jgi:catechol-2,3-dioxygenase
MLTRESYGAGSAERSGIVRSELLKETPLYVTDLEGAERFYEDVIGLEVARRVGAQQSTFHDGDATLILFQAPAADVSTEPGQVTFGISRGAVAHWRQHLHEQGVPIVKEVTWPNGMQSIIFCDPAGNKIHLRTQAPLPSESSEEDPARPAISRGFHAEWKIYHAARQAISDLETATASQG